MIAKRLLGIVCGCAAILLVGLVVSRSGTVNEGGAGMESSTGFGAASQTIDVDHPPATITVAKGGTITLVRYGTSKQNSTVSSYSTDGRGELLMKLSGGPSSPSSPSSPNGTVATFRALRNGRGIIQIRNDKPGPGGALIHTINVTVR